MSKKCSFASSRANGNLAGSEAKAPAAKPVATERAVEDPAVFGGNTTALPSGTVVEFPEEGGYRVVKKPK